MRKEMISESRYFGASAIAAAVPSGAILGLALVALGTESFWGAGTEIDDAPMRGIGILIMLTPIIYLTYFIVLYLCSRLLALLGLLSVNTLALVSIGLMSTALYLQTLGKIGWQKIDLGAEWPFFVVWVTLSLLTLFASRMWWTVAHKN